jgi:hypothetical protein
MKLCTSRAISGLLCASTAIVLGILIIPGCGASSASPNYTKIWGRVTYNSQPLPDGIVIFWPADPGRDNWGAGHISKNGNYVLSASQTETALEPGLYNISIKPPVPLPVGLRGSRFKIDERDPMKDTEAQASSSTPKFPLPKKFTDPKTSGLAVRIDSRPQRVDLDLRD